MYYLLWQKNDFYYKNFLNIIEELFNLLFALIYN
jgi:hypothetical protein